MSNERFKITPPDSDPFGLRQMDFARRVSEISEMFTDEEAQMYIDGCDYPESADDLLLALEVQERFGSNQLQGMKILDVMCGPGRLGRELLNLGAQQVVFHDGAETMLAHARNRASAILQPGQNIETVLAPVDDIRLPDNHFDLVTCHNSTHQLSSVNKLAKAMDELLRLTKPGGHVLIADYQRDNSDEFIQALEKRLKHTKAEMVPFLIPTFTAAFSKREWTEVFGSLKGISNCLVVDAAPPTLAPAIQRRIEQDPVKGHELDYGPISLRVIAQKEKI